MSTTPISPAHATNDLPRLGSARISPDGERIVYVRGQVNTGSGKHEQQIWLCGSNGTGRKRLTWTGASNGGPVWSPDGTRIAYVSHRDGDHPHAICLLGFSGGEARVISSHAAAPSDLAWSPDGSAIAYTVAIDPDNPNETPRDPKAPAPVRVVRRIDYKQDGFGYLNDVRSQVFVVKVDVASGDRRQVTSDTVDHLRPVWSPEGKRVAVSLPHKNGMRARLGVIDVETGHVDVGGFEDGTVGSIAWSPDGMSLLFDGNETGLPCNVLYMYDVEQQQARKLADSLDFLPDAGHVDAATPVWIDESTALVHGFDRGASGLWTIDTSSDTSSDTGSASCGASGSSPLTTTKIGRWEAIHAGMSVSADGTRIVQTSTDLDGTVGLLAIDRVSGERTLLFNEAESFFAESPAAQWEKLSIERGGMTIEAWLLKPADFDAGKRYPLVLDVHGGPHGSYGYGLNMLAETLATHGVLVLLVNPRGSNTYGLDFAVAVMEDWGGEDWKDLEGMLDHVLERPYVDRERTGIYGYSYGGFMTSWVIGHTDRFKAAVCGAPAFDLESFFGTSDIGHVFGPSENGGTPWGARDQLLAHSPSTFIHNATTPTLIVHGEADERCPIGQGEQMFISLTRIGCEVEFVRYPGGFHGFASNGEPAHRVDLSTRILGWFKRYLGDPA